MSTTKQKTSFEKINLQFRNFFNRHPAIPYILKWLLISSIIGISVGSASAGFLQSLDWIFGKRY